MVGSAGGAAAGGRSAETGDGQPGVAGRGGALAAHGRLDEAVGPVGGDEHLAVVLQPERREVDEEVVLVGRREPDLRDLGVRLEHRAAHRVERLLQGAAVGHGEGLEQDLADVVVGLVPVDVRALVAPAGDERGGQDAVVGLGQRRVAVLEEALELRAGGLQDDEVLQARTRPRPGARPRCRRAVTTVVRVSPAAADEGVVVAGPVDGDAVPGVLLDLDPGPGRGVGRLEERSREREGVLLGGRDALLLGDRRRRCSSACRWAAPGSGRRRRGRPRSRRAGTSRR